MNYIPCSKYGIDQPPEGAVFAGISERLGIAWFVDGRGFALQLPLPPEIAKDVIRCELLELDFTDHHSGQRGFADIWHFVCKEEES